MHHEEINDEISQFIITTKRKTLTFVESRQWDTDIHGTVYDDIYWYSKYFPFLKYYLNY